MLLTDPAHALLAFDFDGTLAPITGDPDAAFAHPEAVPLLARLGRLVGGLAVITGRPVEQLLRLAPVEGVAGLDRLVVLGQYGVERWDAASGKQAAPPPPSGVAAVRAELPGLLHSLGHPDAHVEDKGRALAVHVRRALRPQQAYAELLSPLRRLAAAHGLMVEEGKAVLELRAPGNDKGAALVALVRDLGVRCVVFCGDDLGDVPAFEAVATLRAGGLYGLTVCSASGEQPRLAEVADVVVDGPDGLMAWLRELAESLGG
ncbi:MAG: trehalose-phosphatase [Nocardioidaceae bacterium]